MGNMEYIVGSCVPVLLQTSANIRSRLLLETRSQQVQTSLNICMATFNPQSFINKHPPNDDCGGGGDDDDS